MWSLQWHGFEQKLLDELQRQQQCSLFCDTLLQADGISIPAHSCVLAALSPALAQILCRGPAPPSGQSRLLELQTVGAEPLLRLVGFLYSGRLQMEGPAEREQLLEAAAHLGIHNFLEETILEAEEGGRRGERAGKRSGQGEGGRSIEGKERPARDQGTQTDCIDAGPRSQVSPKPSHPVVMTSPSLPTQGHANGQQHSPPRPPASHASCPTMPSEGSDDYFTPSSSVAPGLADISPTNGAPTPAAVAMEIANPDTAHPAVHTVVLSDDVTAAPPMGCASALAALAPGLGSAAPSPPYTRGPTTHVGPGCPPTSESHSPAATESRDGAVLRSEGGAVLGSGAEADQHKQQGGLNQCSSCILISGSIDEEKVGKMRSGRMKSRGQGRGRAGNLRARQRDRQISIKIRLRRQSKGKLWEIVSMREEGMASTTQGGHSTGRGMDLKHRRNLPTLGTIAQSKDIFPVLKRPRRLSRFPHLPQRIFSALTLSPPSAQSSTPTLTPLSSPPPHKPHPLLHTSPANNPVEPTPLPPVPPIPEDSDEQIEKLLDDIMMGLNILPPIVVETDAGGHGDSRNLDPSSPCAYQCPQITESPRPETGLLCPRPQDGPPLINRQSRCMGSQEATYPSQPQQASNELHILDHFLWSRESQADGAWERSARRRSGGGGAVAAGDAESANQPGAGTDGHTSYTHHQQSSVTLQGGSVLAAQSRSAVVTLGQAPSPWRELRIPEFLSPPPPILPSLNELRLPARLSPLGMEAAPPKKATGNSALPKNTTSDSALLKNAAGDSAPPTASSRSPYGPPPPLPPWLCPFPIPLHDLSPPLHHTLQVPSYPCLSQSHQGQRGSPKSVAEGGGTGAEEEAGRLSLDEKRKRKEWDEEEREGWRCRKWAKPAAPRGAVQKMGLCRGGQGRGRARKPPTVSSGRGRATASDSAARVNPRVNAGRASICAVTMRNSNVSTGRKQRAAGCAENLRQSDRSTRKPKKQCICTDDIKRSAVCTDKLKRSIVCADKINRSVVCIDRMKRSAVCADKINRSVVCIDRMKRSAVCADKVPKPSVCASQVKQEGFCPQSLKPPLTCADGQLGAAARSWPKVPPKRGRGRPCKRKIESKKESGGPASILAPCGSSGQMGEHGHKPPSKRKRMNTPSSKELTLRTPRSRACWEGDLGIPSTMTQLIIHGEEERDNGDGEREGEENEMKNRMEDPKQQRSSADGGAEQEAENGDNGGKEGRSENYEEVSSGAELGGGARKEQATPKAERECQAMPTAEGEDLASSTAEGEDQAPLTTAGEDQAPPTAEGEDQSPPTAEGEDQAPPTAEGEDQAPPTAEGEDQAPPTAEGEDQAPPTAEGEDQATPAENDHDSAAMESKNEEGEVDIMGEVERRGWGGEDKRDPGQSNSRGQAPEEQWRDTAAIEQVIHIGQRELDGVRVEGSLETDKLIGQMGQTGGGRDGEEAGEETDFSREEEERLDPSHPQTHPAQPSCAAVSPGLERRDLKAGVTWNQSDPCQGVTDRSTGSPSWDQEEEEVEVDVLECSSPAPKAINLLLESSRGAGLCVMGVELYDTGAGLCDREPSEEEEGEVDVIGVETD